MATGRRRGGKSSRGLKDMQPWGARLSVERTAWSSAQSRARRRGPALPLPGDVTHPRVGMQPREAALWTVRWAGYENVPAEVTRVMPLS